MKMEIIKYKKSIIKCLMVVLVIASVVACDTDVEIWEPKSDQLVIAGYVAADSSLSEFNKILTKSGINSLLSIRGPFTLFVPTDEAIANYCKEKNINSILDLDTSQIAAIVKNHIVATEIQTGDIGFGALRELNGLGDKMVTEFEGSDIIINKSSKIVNRDIKAANGYVHKINKVLEPVTNTLFDLISSLDGYSIFTQGLVKAGLEDTLRLVDFEYGKKMARTNFTLLAVADTIYHRYGITNVDQLISYFTSDLSNLTSLDNDFYRYMEYHCLTGTYFMSDFEPKLYPILSFDNNISMSIDLNNYKLNYNSTDSSFTGFFFDESNYLAKNGALHSLTDILPVVNPEPTVIEFEVTDYFDFKQGDFYGKYYMKWFDGQNTFQYIKWGGDYLQYYYKDPAKARPNKNWDCLNMNGWWWVEITTPKIMKGNYELSGNIWDGNAAYACYVDGVLTATIKNEVGDGKPVLGKVNWGKTETHTIKLVALSYGSLFWDTITLTPIK